MMPSLKAIVITAGIVVFITAIILYDNWRDQPHTVSVKRPTDIPEVVRMVLSPYENIIKEYRYRPTRRSRELLVIVTIDPATVSGIIKRVSPGMEQMNEIRSGSVLERFGEWFGINEPMPSPTVVQGYQRPEMHLLIIIYDPVSQRLFCYWDSSRINDYSKWYQEIGIWPQTP